MFRSKVKSRYRRGKNARFYQGDILKDFEFVIGDSGMKTEKDIIQLEYAIVLSQDCDIENDYKSRNCERNNDKFLRMILVCPAYKIEDFATGDHFSDWKMEVFNSNKIDKLKKNNEYKRYHYLPEQVEFSIPDLVLDFKHFFTLPRDFLYKKRRDVYLASLNELFREALAQRFSNYLFRFGLPETGQ